MRKNRIIRYIGYAIAWSAVAAWAIPGVYLPPEQILSLVILGGALAAMPDGYELDRAKATGWLLILGGVGAFIASGILFKNLAAITMLVSFALVISGTALAGLLDREALGRNG